jgi:hypothetical protein
MSRSAQFFKFFPSKLVTPKRAEARARSLKRQVALAQSAFHTQPFVMTDLARSLFGLDLPAVKK